MDNETKGVPKKIGSEIFELHLDGENYDTSINVTLQTPLST